MRYSEKEKSSLSDYGVWKKKLQAIEILSRDFGRRNDIQQLPFF